MKKRKAGTLKSGRSGRKVKSKKQAIAIGLSEARKKGAKVPKKEIIALQSDDGSTAGAETIQSSSSSSGPDSSSLRSFGLLILRVRGSLKPLAAFCFIWLAAPSATVPPHGTV
jgi:hypothetical protein